MSMIITTVGMSVIADSITTSSPLHLKYMAVGDGNGFPVTPSTMQTSLVNEFYRNLITRYDSSYTEGNTIMLYLVIPALDHDYTIREVGVFDEDGVLVAVGATTDIYTVNSGSDDSPNITIRCKLVITTQVSITLTTDPYYLTIYAEVVNITDQIFEQHCTDVEAHENIGVPSGGTDGDVLIKSGDLPRSAKWQTPKYAISVDSNDNTYFN